MEYNESIAYKNWVENLKEPAPEEAWNAVADQLDIDAAWNGISETLDLDDVWTNVETQLPPATPLTTNDPIAFPKVFWIASALILLTLTTPLPETRQRPVKTVRVEISASDTIRSEMPKLMLPTDTVQTYRKARSESGRFSTVAGAHSKDTTLKDNVLKQDKQLPAHSTGNLLADIIAAEQASSMEHTLAEAPTDSLTVRKLQVDTISELVKPYKSKDSTHQHPARQRWELGVIGSVKNTWLLNPETANGLKRSSLNDTRLTFGKEFGVLIQRNISESSDIRVEYYFFSEIGQRYNEYINALYQSKNVTLRYHKVQILYRTRILHKIQSPSLYALGGFNLSRLRVADSSIGNEHQNITRQYQPWDYGLVLGAEADFRLSDKLTLNTGLRMAYGFRNVYLGTAQTPSEFNKTHTASIGLAIGLRYRIQ